MHCVFTATDTIFVGSHIHGLRVPWSIGSWTILDNFDLHAYSMYSAHYRLTSVTVLVSLIVINVIRTWMLVS